MTNHAEAVRDLRGEPRDEVMHRTRAIDAAGHSVKLVLVLKSQFIQMMNIFAKGLMARCDGNPAAGDTLRIHLPILGEVAAVVRWSLGGRIGCELERTIPLAEYYGMLSVMIRHI